ncbi:MAG: zinc metallopeptidase [Gammaproteobacteria bacterium]|nr:zinc metallopeptidase [Gammaproteobacteria bacterium]MBT8444936.1 zinc metallopeptidase [Gammaproteobacteria bacterium]NND36424.1 zinc metallopeptidase [Gammaproteobacteria bacterium]
MPIIIPILVAALFLIVFGPSWWVRRILSRYSDPEDRYPGTGGELARYLLDQLGLQHVTAEVTDQGDHYDPDAKCVRLTPDKFNGRSLTAITVAAHEVGHAHQDATDYGPLKWRTRLVKLAAPGERVGAAVLMMAPVVTLATRAPVAGVLMLLGGFLVLGLSTVVHLITLPMELDASFGRAMPLLKDGEILKPGDEPHARKLLTAAALTYVSVSLVSLLNIGRWWAILRR